MINRRDFLGMTAGAGALALSPQWLHSLQQSSAGLIQRPIPSTGEMLPVISFAPRPTVRAGGSGPTQAAPTDVPAAREILRTFLDNGGKVVDVLHGGPVGENAARTAAAELGIQDKFFWTTPLSVVVPTLPGYAGPPLKVDPAAVRAAMEEKFARFKVPMIDLVMVGTGGDPSTILSVLREMKREGRVRYVGVHDLATPPYPPDDAFARLESLMRNEQIDFVATDYAVGWRGVEERILPLAQERKIAFMAYFPFDRARFFNRASSVPLPEWAAEFDATTWAQFSLKYVLSHPAVVVARTGTTRAEHMLENIGGGIGRLPDEAMRRRMAQFVDSLPPTPPPTPPQPQQQPQQQQQPPQAPPVVLAAAVLDRYVGEYSYAVTGQTVTLRRDGERLFMKVQGNAPEGPLMARSETRFQGPFGLVFEFQRDAQGRVTGALVEQGPNRFQLERK